ncbi:non-canonical purine NTP pyrophosphatase [Allokutzneria oryzae]|uniref:Non-canonical purine NTP pyrophosphatase n=1 Tax=Allokutzneria oryzae TaxID=1378989 RepID=A0ABV5ZQG5_9PSEU
MIDPIWLITGNAGKAREYSALLGIDVTTVTVDLLEIQSLNVVEVVERKASDAYAKLRRPVLVDDTGLSLTAWNGLPGALVAWWTSTVGVQGILDMASGVTDRRASVTTALGYADADGVQVFSGTAHGTITTEQRGDGGLGFDTIFVPAGSDLTYAEMPEKDKNEVSPRRLAVEEFRKGVTLSTV